MLEEVNFTIQSLRHIPSPRGMGYDIEVVCRKEIVQRPVRKVRAGSL
jgi:hypothetical protein